MVPAAASPDAFVAGFRSALWIAVAFSAAGLTLALSIKAATPATGKARTDQADLNSAAAQQVVKG